MSDLFFFFFFYQGAVPRCSTQVQYPGAGEQGAVPRCRGASRSCSGGRRKRLHEACMRNGPAAFTLAGNWAERACKRRLSVQQWSSTLPVAFCHRAPVGLAASPKAESSPRPCRLGGCNDAHGHIRARRCSAVRCSCRLQRRPQARCRCGTTTCGLYPMQALTSPHSRTIGHHVSGPGCHVGLAFSISTAG